jgi:hypothetical protein
VTNEGGLETLMALWYYDHKWDYTVGVKENLRRYLTWTIEEED